MGLAFVIISWGTSFFCAYLSVMHGVIKKKGDKL